MNLCGHDHCERTWCAVDPWHGITPSASTAVAVIDVDTCPACGAATTVQAQAQRALFWRGGHGADESTTVRRCVSCTWTLTVEKTITNPRRSDDR